MESPDHSSPAHPSLARPKVLRRPTQFSGSTPVTEDLRAESTSDVVIAAFPLTERTQTKKPQATRPFAHRAWQDDGRFAITLLAVVVIVNTVLAMWLGTPTVTTREIIVKQQLPTEPQATISQSRVHVLGEDKPTTSIAN